MGNGSGKDIKEGPECRHGYDSELNHETIRNEMFFAWVMRRFKSIPGIWLSRELILSQFPGKSFESWVDLNQYMGIRLSHELLLSQFPGKPIESWVESIQLYDVLLESWIDSNQNLRRIFESKAKKSHIKKWNCMNGTSQKSYTKSNPVGKSPYHNDIIESHYMIQINIPESFWSQESIQFKILEGLFSRKLIWIKLWKAFWDVSRFESKFWRAIWVMSRFESKFWRVIWVMSRFKSNYRQPFRVMS